MKFDYSGTGLVEIGMGKIFLFVLCLLVFGGLIFLGCNGALEKSQNMVSSSNPDVQAARAQSTLEMANAMARSTQEAARQQVAQATIQAANAQSTDTAQLVSAQMTQQIEDSHVQATATARVADVQASATAQMALVQDQATQSAIMAIATQNAMDIQATAQARQFEIEERALALERARQVNSLRAFLFYGVAILLAGLLVYWVVQRARVRYFERDGSGYPGLIVVDGSKLVDPRLTQGVVTPLNQIPPTTGLEAQVKADSQKVDALRVTPALGASAALRALESRPEPPPRAPVIEVIEPDRVPLLLDEVEGKLYDDPNE